MEDSKASAGRADYEAVAMVEDYKAPAGDDTDHEDLATVEDYKATAMGENYQLPTVGEESGKPAMGRTS